jgi:hypothetical protein
MTSWKTMNESRECIVYLQEKNNNLLNKHVMNIYIYTLDIT